MTHPWMAVVAAASATLCVGLPAQNEPKRPAARAAKLTKPAPQQKKSQSDLILKRAKKLSKPVFQDAEWLFDYDEARAKAKAEGKLVLVYFTRSYAP